MNEQSRRILEDLTMCFLENNYNYVYLKTMLTRGKNFTQKESSLITGSSYALSGIKEDTWKNAVSCSCSSQDLYYDFRCAYDVISSVPANTFSKCFIVKGYYAACHDLSSSKQERERIVKQVYFPLLKDAHNWTVPESIDLFEGISSKTGSVFTTELKNLIEHMAVNRMMELGTYYNRIKPRGGTVFNLNGREWYEVPLEEKDYFGKYRADCHNKLFSYKDTIAENKEIFRDYIHFLHMNNIMPVFVLAPFTSVYNKYILSEMKDSIIELLDAASGEIHFVDFNQSDFFDDIDFVDTDHLSEVGAQKMSQILVNMFGK